MPVRQHREAGGNEERERQERPSHDCFLARLLVLSLALGRARRRH